MATFQLEKGNKFAIDKGIQKVRIGLGWDLGDKPFDLDASIFGLVHLGGGKPVFYNDGSHAVCYANKELKKPDGKFVTSDGSIEHSGDNRTGAGDGDDEVITIDFSKLPNDVIDLAVWVTIYKGRERKQDFSQVKNSYIKVNDAETNAALCEYKLREEFGTATSVQVGSFLKGTDGTWHFEAVGAGAAAEIGDVLQQYS